MKRFLLTGLFLLCAARVSAQPAPTIVSSLQTTSTTTTSLQVGCAIGSSTCTGGIVAGPIIGSALGAESGYVEIQSNVPVSTTFRLYNNAGTLFWNGSAVAIGGSLSGTTNTIPLFTSSNSVGNSIMTQSGTTITVANTLSATTLTGTLSTVSQPNVTTMAALASIGTITTGVWNGTAVGVQWGGTGSNLSGTGGTSQFLRQASVGAAITVVRPAVADLSDNSNVALLNAANTFTGGVQTVQVTDAGVGTATIVASLQRVGASTSGTSREAGLVFSDAANATITGGITGIRPNSSGNFLGGLAFYVNETSGTPATTFSNLTKAWGINNAGDFTFGASSHIADSSGTPTINAGFGTSPSISGTDYAIVITVGSGSPTSGTVNFGHTWSTAPACVPSAVQATRSPFGVSTSTTQLTLSFGASSALDQIYVLCRGF